MTFFGKITLADGSADTGWEGYLVVFTYTAELDGVSRSLDIYSVVRDDGSFSVETDDPVPGDASLSVVSPTGELLGSKQFSTLIEEGTTHLKPFPVKRPELNLVIDPVGPPSGKRIRISGRVFVANGSPGDHTAAAELEVRIFITPRDAEPFVPIFSGITDRSGYLAAFVQQQPVAAAFAETRTGATLVRHSIQVSPESWLPEPMILFIEAKAPEEADCGCTAPPPSTPGATELAVNGETFSADLGAGCQDFTVPNRTLEELFQDRPHNRSDDQRPDSPRYRARRSQPSGSRDTRVRSGNTSEEPGCIFACNTNRALGVCARPLLCPVIDDSKMRSQAAYFR